MVSAAAAVLLVDENDDSRVELRKLLARAQLAVAGEARFGASAATAALELKPDAILVGLEEPPNRALETIENLSRRLLDTPILAYSTLAEVGAVRRATQAGVRDYLLCPLDAGSLRQAILAALAQAATLRRLRNGEEAPPARGSVIAVTGAKGGVGKSVIAINLAVALRQVTGSSVALVDADTHFGDVRLMLNVLGGPSVVESIEMAAELDRTTILERSVEHPSGVRIFAGPPDPEDWQRVAPEDMRRFLGVLAGSFDFVVADTPDIFDRIVEQTVLSATLVLLVTSLDLSSIADTIAGLRILRRWDCPAEKVRVITNHIRRHAEVQDDKAERTLNWPVFFRVPYAKEVPEAGQLGESLLVRSPKAPFSRALGDLAGRVSGATWSESRLPRQRERRGVLARLFKPAAAG
jgi:pilus assembly protein CpaE